MHATCQGYHRLARVLSIVCVVIVGLGLCAGVSAAVTADIPLNTGDGELNVTQSDPSVTDRAWTPLTNASGQTSVIVRFTPVDRADPTIADPNDLTPVELERHADTEQAAFEALAAAHDGIEIEETFWLVNAMLVTVDADVIDRGDLLGVDNVTRIHENVVIESFDSTPSAMTPKTTQTTPKTTQTTLTTSKTTQTTQTTQTTLTTSKTTQTTQTTQTTPMPNARTTAPSTQNDPTAQADPVPEYTPGLQLVGAPEAWDRFNTRGAGATVAVIDTGVDPTHQDIDLAGWAAFDENGTLVSNSVADATDPNGHGTHVAGTIAGGGASGTHIGVAPEAGIYGINTFDADGTARFASVLAGMEHATASREVDVIQMSLGANGTFGGFIQPVRNARTMDTVVIAASGNAGHGTSSAPANVYDSLAVGAVRNDGTIATFSSGIRINASKSFANPPPDWPAEYVVPDVTAPGINVRSAEAGTVDGYVTLQGTSMAAPHVSGIAALAVAATDGQVSGDDLHAALIDTAVHPERVTEPDDRYGHGVVDGPAAIETAVEAAAVTPTPTATPAPTRTPTPEMLEPSTNGRAPGFGASVGIVAMVLAATAALLVGRRQ